MNNKEIKYYIFDIDGTISIDGGKVDKIICDKLYDLSKTKQIIFASARPVRDMLPMLNECLHADSIFIGCNGGMAYKDNHFLFSNLLNNEFISSVLELMIKYKIPYVLDGKWNSSLSNQHHAFQDYIKSLSSYEVSEEQLIQDGITKILILSNHKKDEIIQLAKKYNTSIHYHKKEDFF